MPYIFTNYIGTAWNILSAFVTIVGTTGLESFECNKDSRRKGKSENMSFVASTFERVARFSIANGRPLADLEEILGETSRNLLVQGRRRRSR